MLENGFRFSHDRLVVPYSYAKFMVAANALVALARLSHPSVSATVITCEDMGTYLYANVTLDTDEVRDALMRRQAYAFSEFSEGAWKRSLDVQLTLRDHGLDPFMVTLSCDRCSDARRLLFYGQYVSAELRDAVTRTFVRSWRPFFIGDGFSKPSAFNYAYGKKFVGA